MKILAIETSCDETAVSIVEAGGGIGNIRFSVLGNALLSQVPLHKEYGGVFPALAKREHAKNLVPIMVQALSEANLYLHGKDESLTKEKVERLKTLLEREPELFVMLIAFFSSVQKPDIDALAVTVGPGLEPALWVGINFAKALAYVWDLPLIPINHMEGHVISSLIKENEIANVELPALALLISGGHTELVLMKEWGQYEIVGETKDDAVGEAFDKVARTMDLQYPGGPEISKLAQQAREENLDQPFSLPRPMHNSPDFDFSFSGLKTAVLYLIREKEELSETDKKQLAREFEDAAADVLVRKTLRALDQYGAQTLIVGGGVSANKHIRFQLETHVRKENPDIKIFIPPLSLTGDNAIMIAAAAYLHTLLKKPLPDPKDIKAVGNLNLE